MNNTLVADDNQCPMQIQSVQRINMGLMQRSSQTNFSTLNVLLNPNMEGIVELYCILVPCSLPSAEFEKPK